MYSLDKEKHQVLDEFQETIETADGKFRTVEQHINRHHIKIRMSCASCKYSSIVDDNTVAHRGCHNCSQTSGIKSPGHSCSGWTPKQIYEDVGSELIHPGKVQTADYIHWRVANEGRVSKIFDNKYPKGTELMRPSFSWFLRETYKHETGCEVYYNPNEK